MQGMPDASTIAAAINGGLSGPGSNGQTVCASANTWYALPSGSSPTAAYELLANHETTAGIIRVAFSNSGIPGTTNGVIWPKNVLMTVLLGSSSDTVYVSSSNAGDTINWSTKLVV